MYSPSGSVSRTLQPSVFKMHMVCNQAREEKISIKLQNTWHNSHVESEPTKLNIEYRIFVVIVHIFVNILEVMILSSGYML